MTFTLCLRSADGAHVDDNGACDGTASTQTHTGDHFNYAGIHRSVHLYSTPNDRIVGIHQQTTSIDHHGANTTARLHYTVHTSNATMPLCLTVAIKEPLYPSISIASGRAKGIGPLLNFTVTVPNARLWWPRWMHPKPGFLYTAEFMLLRCDPNADGTPLKLDVYELPVGVRTVQWTDRQLLINGRPAYMRGVGRHEDSHVGRTLWQYRALKRH